MFNCKEKIEFKVKKKFMTKLEKSIEKQVIKRFTYKNGQVVLSSPQIRRNINADLIKEAMVELKKCRNNPYYFATKFMQVKTKEGNIPFKTSMKEQEFNELYKHYSNQWRKH